jgi:hypothetical protein
VKINNVTKTELTNAHPKIEAVKKEVPTVENVEIVGTRTPQEVNATQELIFANDIPTTETKDIVTENIPAPGNPATGQPASPGPSLAAQQPLDEVIPPYRKTKSKFQLYFSVTPFLSFQKLTPVANDELIVAGLGPRSSLSMKRFGFGIDAGFQKDINKILGFYGGISYYHQEQQLTYNYYDKDASVNRVGDALTFEIKRPMHSKTFDYSMSNLGARAGLLITLKGETLKHKFGAGLMYSHGLKTSANYVAYQLSYRSELSINERISWFVEPTFIYSFISREKLQEPFTLKPYRAGLSTGLLYRF